MVEYRVVRYAPDGHGIPDRVVWQGSSLADARDFVRRSLGVRRLHPSRYWAPTVANSEGWNEYPPSHPNADGCGGYVIVRIEEDARWK